VVLGFWANTQDVVVLFTVPGASRAKWWFDDAWMVAVALKQAT
jgi:hypothetical protein